MTGNFVVLDFEDGPQVVPTSWLTEKGTKCKWPPYNLFKTQEDFYKSVEMRINPQPDWTDHIIVKTVAECGNYEMARRKLADFELHTDVDTDYDENGRPKRRVKSKMFFGDDSDEELPRKRKKSAEKKVALPSLPPIPNIQQVQDSTKNTDLRKKKELCIQVDAKLQQDKVKKAKAQNDNKNSKKQVDEMRKENEGKNKAKDQKDNKNSKKQVNTMWQEKEGAENAKDQNDNNIRKQVDAKAQEMKRKKRMDQNDTKTVKNEVHEKKGTDSQIKKDVMKELDAKKGYPMNTTNGKDISKEVDSVKEDDSKSKKAVGVRKSDEKKTNEPNTNKISPAALKLAAEMTEQEFKAFVISEVTFLRNHIQSLELVRTRKNNAAGDISLMQEESPLQGLPVTSVEELEAFNKKLCCDPTYRAKVIKALAQKGGANCGAALRTLLASVMSNHVATKYTWFGGGALKKMKYSDTEVQKVMTKALRIQSLFKDATDKDIRDITSGWLRLASNRAGGKPEARGEPETSSDDKDERGDEEDHDPSGEDGDIEEGSDDERDADSSSDVREMGSSSGCSYERDEDPGDVNELNDSDST